MVTVTYGDRLEFLRESVRRALEVEGVARVVVVGNASTSPLATLEQQWGDRVRIIRLPANTGSANGYAVGIQAALDDGAEYLWLMDDDNAPQPGALAELHRAYHELRNVADRDALALRSYRPTQQTDIASGMPVKRLFPRAGSFFGFHLLDLPAKLWRRTPWGRPKSTGQPPALISLPSAPYGGLFCHRAVYERIGLPDVRLVLYADDTELTSRLTRLGGKIFLVTSSLIDDLESSWNNATQFGSAFAASLRGASDFRAFYSARNHAYLETLTGDHRLTRALNRRAYLTILLALAILQGRLGRYRLLRAAISLGEAGRLGTDERFPLP
jgi:GT2 family glycosyltransferase